MGILDRGIANIIGKLTERIKNRNFLLKMKRNVIDAFLFFFFFFFQLNEKTQIQPFSRNLEHRLAQTRKNIQTRAIDATIQVLCYFRELIKKMRIT